MKTVPSNNYPVSSRHSSTFYLCRQAIHAPSRNRATCLGEYRYLWGRVGMRAVVRGLTWT